jgi:hypothetical protein
MEVPDFQGVGPKPAEAAVTEHAKAATGGHVKSGH